jgi:hypothetical protein
MNKYPIYGGPLDGKETEEAATIYTARPNVMAALQSGDTEGMLAPKYLYCFVKADDARWFFVPDNDQDLVKAYEETNGEPGDPKADALAAELDRRNIGFELSTRIS